MNAMDKRTARTVMGGLVTAGAMMAVIGTTRSEPQVATVLPTIGAALVAAGLVIVLHAESLNGRQAMVVGASLLTAGVAMTLIGSIETQVAVSIALVSLGGALGTAGTLTVVSGAATIGARAGLSAR